MKNEKGSVTLVILFAMLIFSIYGIIFYGNSASSYIRQTRTIEAIQRTYSKDVEKAYEIVENLD